MAILIITTGGTIGAEPYSDPQRPPEFSVMPGTGKDYVQDAVLEKFAHFAARCHVVEPRDSKLIDKNYLDNLALIIESAEEDQIIITHGTDRMLQSAQYFYDHWSDHPFMQSKAIILVGAMVPLSNGALSDGYQNLSFALEYADSPDVKPGVFIALSDFEMPDTETGNWLPRLYDFHPGTYEKIYAADGRYNRLKRA